MANDYYEATDLVRNTLAKAEDINTRMQAVETAFDLLPDPHEDGPTTKGFSEVFRIEDGSHLEHPVSVSQTQNNSVRYAADSGSANTYVVTLTGLEVYFTTSNANTGASTINVNALGVKNIVKLGALPLSGGEILASGINKVIYDGTNFVIDYIATTDAVLLDEDDMASDSAVSVASQQSIRAFITSGTVTMSNKTLTSPVLNTGVSGTAVKDEDNMSSDSSEHLCTQQSIKAYTDTHASDTTTHGATGAVVGTTNTQTLTNKTLTTPVIDDGDAGLTVTSANQTNASPVATIPDIGDAADTFVMADTPQTLTNKTLTSPVLNTGVSGTAVKDEDNMSSDSSVHLCTQQSIKKYVDTRIRVVVVKCMQDSTLLTTGDGKAYFTVPSELNGMDLFTVGAHVYTASSSGTPTFMIHNLTDSQDMLATALTIDANEKDSKDATASAVINGAYDDVAIGDELRFDCDVAGTGTRGMEIRMGFRIP